jgi:hypothetical protein
MCCVPSHYKQLLLPSSTLADWICITEVESVYALSPYIKQTGLDLGGLNTKRV